jgi:pilus assembly protein Flp/PilA
MEKYGFLRKFRHDQSGVSAIEYALIAGGIGMAIVVIVGEVGTEVNTLFVTMKGLF